MSADGFVNLKGRVVLVTDSSKVGEEIARLCGSAGAAVMLVAQKLTRRDALVRRLREELHIDTVQGLVADILDEQEWQRVIDETVEAFGSLHVLFNVHSHRKRLPQTLPAEEYSRKACAVQAAIARLPDKVWSWWRSELSRAGPERPRVLGWQCAVVNGSVLDERLAELQQPEALLAATVVMRRTRAMALEMAEYGAQANCITCGDVITAESWSKMPSHMRDQIPSQTPLRRFRSPTEAAAAFVMLARRRLNGEVLHVEGGFGR